MPMRVARFRLNRGPSPELSGRDRRRRRENRDSPCLPTLAVRWSRTFVWRLWT